MDRQSFEGTWEEIQSHVDDLSGHQVRVTVIDNITSPVEQKATPLSSAISLIEAARRRHHGQSFSDSTTLVREDRER